MDTPQLDKLADALAKASSKFPVIERGCTAKVRTKAGGEYSYDYADLDDVLRAVRGPLADNGLTLTHDHVVHREPFAVETTAMLVHSSGQFLKTSPLYIPCDGTMAPAQLVGSACTYGRRYTTQAILGLSTEADDDGNGAGGNDASTGKREPLPACPKCQKTTSVIVGQAQYGGGLVCFKKKQGCGHTWATEAHPATPKEGEGNVPSDQSNGKKPPKAEEPPASCKEYNTLGNFLRNCRPDLEHTVTPEEATKIINWAVPGVGDITSLRMMAGECKQIFEALRGTNLSGPQIYAEAVAAAAV